MNTNCYRDINKSFKIACELSEKTFSHSELMNMLDNGNVQEKQIAALYLDFVNNPEEGKILINNLTGCDGKIREAVALKINTLLMTDDNIGPFLNYPKIFAQASIDINANICRLVIDSVNYMKKQTGFSKEYINIIILFINEAFNEIDKFIYKDKKYIINKQFFKLYWCLESLKFFVDEIDSNILLQILTRASDESEYTIREKAAQIITLVKNKKYESLKIKLINDKNYYVRAVFQKCPHLA